MIPSSESVTLRLGGFAWGQTAELSRPRHTIISVIYYRVTYPDGTVGEWAEYEGILSFNVDGTYNIDAYAVADCKSASEEVSYDFEVVTPSSVAETVAGKQVAAVRYYNLAGQEMQQADGVTIVVTTYTDGTVTAVKVMK